MEYVVLWIVLCAVAGMIAKSRGRSGGGYFFLSLVVSPLVGIVLACALPPNAAAEKPRSKRPSGGGRNRKPNRKPGRSRLEGSPNFGRRRRERERRDREDAMVDAMFPDDGGA